MFCFGLCARLAMHTRARPIDRLRPGLAWPQHLHTAFVRLKPHSHDLAWPAAARPPFLCCAADALPAVAGCDGSLSTRAGCSPRARRRHRHSNAFGESEDGDGGVDGAAQHDPALKRALEDSKMEAVAAEYNHLLASQLDSQRQYFEVSLAGGRAAAFMLAVEKACTVITACAGISCQCWQCRP